MKIVAITPDRSDRPDFLDLCKWQMARQTKPIEHRIINYPPESNDCDITQRVRRGYEEAIDDGADYVAIIENDDYYPTIWIEELDYLLNSIPPTDLVGTRKFLYYNIVTLDYTPRVFGRISPLFCTVLGKNIPEEAWPPDKTRLLDTYFWSRLKKVDTVRELTRRYFIPTQQPVGIKHGIGKTVTAHHKGIKFEGTRKDDLKYSKLRKITDGEYFNRLMEFVPSIIADRYVSTIREQQQLDRSDVAPLPRSVRIRPLQQ